MGNGKWKGGKARRSCLRGFAKQSPVGGGERRKLALLSSRATPRDLCPLAKAKMPARLDDFCRSGGSP